MENLRQRSLKNNIKMILVNIWQQSTNWLVHDLGSKISIENTLNTAITRFILHISQKQ